MSITYPQGKTVEREPQITEEIDRILGEIELINEAITALGEKISPVLKPESPPLLNEQKALSANHSPLLEKLVGIKCCINNIKQSIEEITQRVDL